MAVLHRASWVVPVVSPPIENGGVIIDHGRIIEVDTFENLTSLYAQTIDHGEGILMPGLVNCHTHLELSHCHAEGQYTPAGDMVGWIRELLASRAIDPPELIAAQARKCLEDMYAEGVDLIADIGNDPSLTRDHIKGLQVLFFHELLGLSKQAAEFMLETMASGQSLYTCHAPYSTNKELLLQVKESCREVQQIFPIHTAESRAEVEFLQSGQGDFRRFIEELGGWDNSFTAPGCSPVQYLYDLDLLDNQTLCVHCVQVDDHDLQLLRQTKSRVCLCIGSNEYLGVGFPPVEEMLMAGLRPCLGTDSLASNPVLSMWREMNLIHHYYPNIPAITILNMATRNGALALGCPEYGGLAENQASMIFVKYTGQDPLEYLAFDTAQKHVARWL